ncbi:Uncharacterised protein [Bordetella pertussis]|nr:Uncharacterised protein [Bordetella pertussis]CFP69196.1 Uncharacterised protein [Bordetella pertussis]
MGNDPGVIDARCGVRGSGGFRHLDTTAKGKQGADCATSHCYQIWRVARLCHGGMRQPAGCVGRRRYYVSHFSAWLDQCWTSTFRNSSRTTARWRAPCRATGRGSRRSSWRRP